MNKTLLLAKTLLKNGSGKTGKGKTKSKRVLYIVLLLCAFIPIISMISGLIAVLYTSFAQVNQESMLLGLGLTISSIVIFTFGIFYVINVFYFSQDIEHLLPLPLKPSQILTGKFIVTLLYEYLTELFLLAPILITFGIKSGAGVLYYVYALIIFLALPIVPLVLSSVIAMIVMRFTNIAKNKDRFRLFGGVIAVVFGLGINMFIQKFSRSVNPDQLQEMILSGNNSMLGLITNTFPSTKLSATALIEATALRGFVGLLGFIALSALVYAVFAILGERLYFKGVMGISESTSKRERVTDEQLDRQTAQNSTIKAHLIKEIKLVLRTPVYFINCVLISFLSPVFVCIPLFASSGKLGNIEGISQLMADENIAGIIIGIGFALFLFVAGANPTAATAISREGSNLYVLKYLPVPYAKPLVAKALTGALTSMISVVLILPIAIFLIKLPIILAVQLLILSVPAVLFGNFAGLIIDTFSPKLNWDTEQKAVKQNMNSLFSMLVNFIVAGIIVAVSIFFDVNMLVMFGSLLVLFIVLDIILYRILVTKGSKWLSKIEA
ncbi:hypothetical protein E0485_10405 [Paenibacillus albiflavus]|uniref:Uncharacterized protein n=1 Tax=Paenibacillus albiflavus TaxID=2545760 RepID=A0A4R4EGM3_9BACL|nr:hypothetical protein [Paenibacillus albiflavus]TCZ77401.1 hypothetical protein E0485_10405 [Paenibacillus albiflavus]